MSKTPSAPVSDGTQSACATSRIPIIGRVTAGPRRRDLNIYENGNGVMIEIDDTQEDGLHFLAVMRREDFARFMEKARKVEARIAEDAKR